MEALVGMRVPFVELVVRGTAVYWFIFILFRFLLRRDMGQLGVADILLLVLISDAAQNAMAGGYTTISEGFVLIGTIAAWNALLDWLAWRFPLFTRLLEPPPLLLVRHGRVLYPALRRRMITVEELKGKLRQQGIESLKQVRRAYLESDGAISVIKDER